MRGRGPSQPAAMIDRPGHTGTRRSCMTCIDISCTNSYIVGLISRGAFQHEGWHFARQSGLRTFFQLGHQSAHDGGLLRANHALQVASLYIAYRVGHPYSCLINRVISRVFFREARMLNNCSSYLKVCVCSVRSSEVSAAPLST